MTSPIAPEPKEQKPDVPTEVFQTFLASLKTAGISEEVTARFKKTLLDDRTFGETALKKAVFGEETLP